MAAPTAAFAAMPEPSTPMPLGVAALPPSGFVAFCRKDPAECDRGAPSTEPAPDLAPDPRLLATLDSLATTPIVTPRTEPTAAIDTDSLQLGAALGGHANNIWLNLAHRRVKVRYAATYSLELPSPDTALTAPNAAPTGGASVRLDVSSAMAQLNAYRSTGQAGQRGPTQIASGPIELTPDLWREVKSVNDHVNRAIARRSDLQIYGVEENWALPLETGVNAGDCEDFVLEKRHALLEAGVPRSALSIAVVLTFRGERHAVLVLNTDRGDYVLDSLTPWILPWSKAGYTWVERQVAGSKDHWAGIGQNDSSALVFVAL